MRIFDSKTTITLIITFTLLMVLFAFNNTSYALSLNMPTIVSFNKQSGENNALRLEFKSNNEGYNYSYEIINITTGKSNNVSGVSNFFVYQGLENKKYTVQMRACTNNFECSPWTNSVTANLSAEGTNPEKKEEAKPKTPTNPAPTKPVTVPKPKTPTITELKASSETSAKLNYTAGGTITGVEIYNVNTKKTKKTTNKTNYTITGLKQDTKYSFRIRSYYTKNGITKMSNWSNTKSIKIVSIKSKVNKLKKYSKYKRLKIYSKSNTKKIATIKSGRTEKVPQSFCYDGSRYIVQFSRQNSDSYGRLVSFTKHGKKTKVGSKISTGHGNGLTCSKELSHIYSVNRGQKRVIKINKKSFKKSNTKSISGKAYSIAYDEYTNQFYVTGGGRVTVLNKNLKKVKSFRLKTYHAHLQDAAGYHGMILQAFSANKSGSNYIEIYRIKDGAYLGAYYVSFGELESVTVVDGYLVLLINIVGTSNDYIYKSKSKIPLP